MINPQTRRLRSSRRSMRAGTYVLSGCSLLLLSVVSTTGVSAFQLQRPFQRKHTTSLPPLCVSTTPAPAPEEPALPPPLISMDDDDSMEETVSGFFDLEDDNEPTDLDYTETPNEEEEDEILFTREEAERLEEEEDRLYVDEYGVKRKIEKCILIGVEDQTAKRQYDRKSRQQNEFELAAASASSRRRNLPSENNQQQDEDVYYTLEESMTEMRELIKTAGLEVVGEITQNLKEINPKTYVGTGKVKEAEQLLQDLNCCTVVFDAELTPGQQKALENAFNKNLLQNDFLVSEREIKVVDRTALILDIFAQHAKTREGKLQVDLALHEYRKPRLTKMWTHLERQSGAGGVGLRGPGESQLEIDKRLLRDRIGVLKQKIDDVQKQRTLHRRGRDRTGLPVLSLVGYTNAGKSTLLNYLTRAGVMAQSMLFATLDPTTRKVKLPGYKTHPEVLLTDTVGFIQKLPTHLVAAFRATLEEVQQADVLVHVIDVSNPMYKKQERSVLRVLKDMGAADKPIVRVLNKIDLVDSLEAERLRYEAIDTPHTVVVSSLLGEGMQDFVAVVEEAMAELLVPFEAVIPYSKGDELNAIHEQGNVEIVDYREKGTYVRALVPVSIANRLDAYRIQDEAVDLSQPDDIAGEEDEMDWSALARGRHSSS